jgi:hypothetical protein
MKITEIIPTELSGYCDVETGECITAETGTPQDTPTEKVAPIDDQDRRRRSLSTVTVETRD